jgi:energy-coupling factor transport system permease protein
MGYSISPTLLNNGILVAMIKNMTPGIFYPGKSLLHRLQARTKLLSIVLLIVMLLIANQREWHFAPYIVAVALIICSVLCSGIRLRDLWRRLSILLILVFGSVFLSIFGSFEGSPVVWRLGPWLPRAAFIHEILLIISLILGVLWLLSLLRPIRAWYRRRFWLRVLQRCLLLLLLLSFFLLWLLGKPSVSSTLTIGPLLLTRDGIWIMMVSFVVFTLLYTSSILLTMTTSPVALIEGLTLLLTPLRRLKLPVDDFALMALLALRFIPTLMDEGEQLIKAQLARGSDVMHGTLMERFQSLMMFFTPLIHGTLRRASELATALDARGFRSEGPRTLLYERPLRRLDYIVLSIVIVAAVGSLFL